MHWCLRRHRSRAGRERDLAHDHRGTRRAHFPAIGTQVNATTICPLPNAVMTKQSRGRDHADLLIMSPEHYAAYDAATTAIQRQNQ